jgi:PHD/YefM family antitoxin component YafN of YafNO toxin-antitoxin module
VRYVAKSRDHVAITSRGHVAAIMISAAELAELDQAALHGQEPRSNACGARSRS